MIDGLPPNVFEAMSKQINSLPTKGKVAFLLLLLQMKGAHERGGRPEDMAAVRDNIARFMEKFINPLVAEAAKRGETTYHVCPREKGAESPHQYPDNKVGECTVCNEKVIYRPNVPEGMVMVCIECSSDILEAEKLAERGAKH